MGNRHGNPTRPPLDLEGLESNSQKHIDLAGISDDVLAAEMQLAECALLYESAKADRSYVASRGLQKDMRDLQGLIRNLHADELARQRDTLDADVDGAIEAIESLPERVQRQIIGHFSQGRHLEPVH